MADSPSDKLAAAEFANAPILGPGYDYASVTDKISAIVLARRTPKWWIIGFLISFALVMLLMVSVTYLLVAGVGIWGIQIPVAWGFAIINFVWWIGIGHAGTLISAILLLLRQQWRTSINRFAEAMTLFAVSCAGLFPLIHMGRPWLGYWLFPYPDTMKMWPNFRSPLVWDAFAVSTYATVSLLFWFIGLIPDLATLRDRAKNRAAKLIYGLLAMGWRGSAVHWPAADVDRITHCRGVILQEKSRAAANDPGNEDHERQTRAVKPERMREPLDRERRKSIDAAISRLVRMAGRLEQLIGCGKLRHQSVYGFLLLHRIFAVREKSNPAARISSPPSFLPRLPPVPAFQKSKSAAGIAERGKPGIGTAQSFRQT